MLHDFLHIDYHQLPVSEKLKAVFERLSCKNLHELLEIRLGEIKEKGSADMMLIRELYTLLKEKGLDNLLKQY